MNLVFQSLKLQLKVSLVHFNQKYKTVIIFLFFYLYLGAGLAFVVYPEAVAKLPLSPIWSCLFFSMLLTLGLGTQFTLIETVVTTVVDTWPEKLRHRKPLVLCATCGIMYSLGLVICTNGGMYILQLMDDYCASFSALIIGLVEVVVICWVYGVDRFLEDIKVMLGHFPFPKMFWKFLWSYFCPLITIVIKLLQSLYVSHLIYLRFITI